LRADRQYQDAPDEEEQLDDQGSSFGSASAPTKADLSIEKEDDVKQQDVRTTRIAPLEKNGVEQRHVRASTVTLPGKSDASPEVHLLSRYLSKPMSEDCVFLMEWASEFRRLAVDERDAEDKRYQDSAKGFSSATTIDSLRSDA
jgi:hypothetical protein